MPFTVKKPTAIDPTSLTTLGTSVKDLARWTEDEFREVASALQGTEPDHVWNSVPPKPRRGTYAYADGTHWNPGVGEGPYTFDGTNWNALANQTVTIPPPFPSGTVMIFYQASAPTSWTKLTAQNDKALRVTSGSGGVAGGTNAFSTVMAQTVVGGHALSASEMPSHNHTINGGTGLFHFDAPPGGGQAMPGGSGASTVAQTDSSGGGASHNHSITMSMQYIDVILASKN